jgi:hypothetical protein
MLSRMNPLGRIACGAVLACGLAVSISGQKATAGEPVAVDFFALGPDGSVFDLRADEITLKIDGRGPRRIRSLRYVPLSQPDPAGVSVQPSSELEPPFGTNAITPDVRWVSIVVDHESIRPGAAGNAINTAVRYIRLLGPRDRVSYVTMPNGGVEIDFTTDHQQVIDALRKFVARGPREPSEQERSCRSRLLLNTMSSYLEGLAPVQGPKTVVLLSSGVMNPRRDAPMLGPPGPCEIRQVYFQEVSTAASIARAHLYVVQPDDLAMDSPRDVFVDRTASRFSDADEDRAGLESIAGVTGGDFMRIVGPDDRQLTDHVRGLTGYYIATFEPAPGERNGAMHRVELNVGREGVRVKTNPELQIPRAAERAIDASPRDMLRNGLTYRALPIRTTAFASAGPNGRVKVLTVLEGVERDVMFAEAMFALIDGRDRLVAQWTANSDELGQSPVVTAGEGAAGPYRLRVAAIDAAGRRGTAEYEFLAGLTAADPLSLSSLALGVSRDGTFHPKLVFGSDQAAVAYFEIYGRTERSDSVTVRLEVASSADGRALTTGVPRVVSQGENRRIVIGALPIASLTPGDYMVRAIVSLDGRPVGRVARTLRKSPAGT